MFFGLGHNKGSSKKWARAMQFVQTDDNRGKAEKLATRKTEVRIPPLDLAGALSHPAKARALVVFAHGSGSSRLSPRNVLVADALNRRGIATLLFDLLLPSEDEDRRNVFDVRLLAQRLIDAVGWVKGERNVEGLPVGLFGASTSAAAALIAAAALGARVGAVVSRGGRPDLANGALEEVRAPTLLIVGGAVAGVIELNQWARDRLSCEKALKIVPGATHLFPEPGALEAVIELASEWFELHLMAGKREPDGRREPIGDETS
jgi:pimeloyl-ACP methyl ester carboxylesterase